LVWAASSASANPIAGDGTVSTIRRPDGLESGP
jgi:hypothetical protein